MRYLKRFENNSTGGDDFKAYELSEFLITLQEELDELFDINIGGSRMDKYQFTRVSDVVELEKYISRCYKKCSDDTYIEINDVDDISPFISSDISNTYIDFTLDDFNLDKLKADCNKDLDEMYSEKNNSWSSLDSRIKDKYDVLCQTILVVIDKVKNSKK